jgi:CheY-like chemotaxis protein
MAKILVVEDELGMRELVASTLERAGHEVRTAASGQEALALWTRERDWDLLLTDVVMPGLSGTQLAEQLAVDRPDLNVLYMSGFAGHDLVDRGEPFIAKPFAADDLLAAVEALVRRTRPRRRAT